MKFAFVRWKDSSHGGDYTVLSEIGSPIEVNSAGFLIKETDEAVTIAIEHPGESGYVRLYQVIQRVNIEDLRIAEIDKAFPKRKRR